MTDERQRHQPTPDRARRRAIRAQAARTGVRYSVAARQLQDASGAGEAGDTRPEEARVRSGAGLPPRPGGRRLAAHRAAELPGGRAEHLTERFPTTRGEPGTGAGPLYQGEGRQEALALLYLVVAHETPQRVPSAIDLAWDAELGGAAAVDAACAGVDRGARLLLDGDRVELSRRIRVALAAGVRDPGARLRTEASRLNMAYRVAAKRAARDGGDRLALPGARHTLDAVLAAGADGYAPGARVRMLAPPHDGRSATVVGAEWTPAGPPTAYQVHPDGAAFRVRAEPDDLAPLRAPDQSELAGAR